MNTRVYDQDLINDPIYLVPMRNPVATSDGRIYEATSLLAVMQNTGKSPITRELITSAIFLRPLKNALDQENLDDRPEDYDVAPVLAEIQKLINMHQSHAIDKLESYLTFPSAETLRNVHTFFNTLSPYPELNDWVKGSTALGLVIMTALGIFYANNPSFTPSSLYQVMDVFSKFVLVSAGAGGVHALCKAIVENNLPDTDLYLHRLS